MNGAFSSINVIKEVPRILDNLITRFMSIKGRKKSTDISMRDIKEFINLKP